MIRIVTPRLIWVPTILVLLAGLLLDLTILESAFPRSGAIVIALSIPFFFWGQKQNADYRSNPVQKGLLELTDGDTREFGKIDPGSAGESVARSFKTVEAIGSAEVGLARAEIWVLVTGTLTWAFGDLIVHPVRNLLNCGQFTC